MDEYYMKKAIELAKKASFSGDVPIGALVVYQDLIIGQGYNQKETKNNALYHAELQALNQAADYLKSWWLEDCCLYVTLEPCSMCAGALINTRISRLVYGAKNKRFGAVESSIQLLTGPASNHTLAVRSGVLEEECSSLLTDFFKKLRK
ncbi:adenosine deaminase [Tissierellia bacterium S5-A11]|nr:adenosine deaminase [Tissierellia bacterium S5-A11]